MTQPLWRSEATTTPRITGESQVTSVATAQELARFLIGRDVSDVEHCMADIDRFLVHNSSKVTVQ